MFKNNYTPIFILILLLWGCASNPPVNKKDVPSWYLSPPKLEKKYVGIGSADRPDLNMSKTSATTRAKADLSRQISSKISNIVRDYSRASGKGQNADYIEFNEIVIKEVSSNVLEGCVTDRLEVIDGQVFVMVTYDEEKARESGKESIRRIAKEKALYEEMKAREAFDQLDNEINKMGAN